jgi:hypothetical protein
MKEAEIIEAVKAAVKAEAKAVEEKKSKTAILTDLCKLAWTQFNERRKYEFQLSLALWASLSAFWAIMLTTWAQGKLTVSFLFATVVTCGLLFLLLAYCIWIVGLAKANLKDQKKALHYEGEIKNICPDPIKFTENLDIFLKNSVKREPSKWKIVNFFVRLGYWFLGLKVIRQDPNSGTGSNTDDKINFFTPLKFWSHGTQIIITGSYIAAAIGTVWFLQSPTSTQTTVTTTTITKKLEETIPYSATMPIIQKTVNTKTDTSIIKPVRVSKPDTVTTTTITTVITTTTTKSINPNQKK